MAAGSNGYRAALVSRQLMPGLISSLPETAELLQFISFSTSYPELDSALRPLMRGIGDLIPFVSDEVRDRLRICSVLGRLAPAPRASATPVLASDPLAFMYTTKCVSSGK